MIHFLHLDISLIRRLVRWRGRVDRRGSVGAGVGGAIDNEMGAMGSEDPTGVGGTR
jgi:hypothetical protein